MQVDVNALAGMQLMISDALGLDVYMGLGYKNYAISRVVGANRTIVTPLKLVISIATTGRLNSNSAPPWYLGCFSLYCFSNSASQKYLRLS